MASNKLTDGNGGTIAKAKPPEKGQRFIFDNNRAAPQGFGLRITAAAGKAFILKYRFDGKVRRMTIGQWPTWSLTAARERARELVTLVNTGTDPLEINARRRNEPTVADAVEDFVDRYVSGLVSVKPVTRYFERDVIPGLGTGKKLSDVSRRDLLDLIENKAVYAPTAARRLLSYLKVFFEWCVDREIIPMSPAAGIKPSRINVKGKKNALKPITRKRILADQEIIEFWNNVESKMNVLTALALKLILVTGQRPGEVAGMHEREIKGDVWTIPAERRQKTETEQKLGLTPLAIDLIEQARVEVNRLSKRRTVTTGFIFEAKPGKSLAADALPKAIARNREQLGNIYSSQWGYWTPHDLRRTCRTGLGKCGVPDEIGERVVGHVPEKMVDTYNNHQYIEEKRRALESWNRYLMNILNKGLHDNVTRLSA